MIQWFPGHMKKALRELEEISSVVDIFIILLDARVPFSSYNFEFDKISPHKPRLFIITKKDLADINRLNSIESELKKRYTNYLILNLKNNKDIKKIFPLMQKLIIIKANNLRRPRAAIIGIPNSGKSTLINTLAKKKITRVGNKPGVTRGKQWISLDDFQLLDTPGILWPKFENSDIAIKLALIGSIRYDIIEKESFVIRSLEIVAERYPDKIENLGIDLKQLANKDRKIFDSIAIKKGMNSSNAIDFNKIVNFLTNSLRDMKGITLD